MPHQQTKDVGEHNSNGQSEERIPNFISEVYNVRLNNQAGKPGFESNGRHDRTFRKFKISLTWSFARGYEMSFEENVFSNRKGRSNKLNNHTCQLRNITLYDIASTG
jgi:hypothetical protein